MILDLIASRNYAEESEVRAMPMVMRIERVDPPSRTALLEAGARPWQADLVADRLAETLTLPPG